MCVSGMWDSPNLETCKGGEKQVGSQPRHSSYAWSEMAMMLQQCHIDRPGHTISKHHKGCMISSAYQNLQISSIVLANMKISLDTSSDTLAIHNGYVNYVSALNILRLNGEQLCELSPKHKTTTRWLPCSSLSSTWPSLFKMEIFCVFHNKIASISLLNLILHCECAWCVMSNQGSKKSSVLKFSARVTDVESNFDINQCINETQHPDW